MRTEDLNIVILLRVILLCQIRAKKNQDKEILSVCTNTFWTSYVCLVCEACCAFPVTQTILQELAKSEHSWIYLGFSQNLALDYLTLSDDLTPLCDSFLQLD